MKQPNSVSWYSLAPWLAGGLALAALVFWLRAGGDSVPALRIPGTDKPPGAAEGGSTNAVLAGKRIPGRGQPANLPGAWPQFRGPARDGISREVLNLPRSWGPAGPRELWAIDVGEGYAGAAVLNGRVYLLDYDREHKQDALRCLSLADGQEIWRYAYPVAVKRNHGMSRTVPAVTDKLVVAVGPKCHVTCVDAVSGELQWGLDLVRQFGATVPQWYAGQCPLVDGTNVILAPGGPEALLVAVDSATGNVVWQTPNFTNDWKMTHVSVMPMDLAGRRTYVYCGSAGVLGVSATDGSILWTNLEWRISIATVPSPVILPGNRIFLSGGYDAGSLMLQLSETNGQIEVKTLFRLAPGVFGATQQTPIFHEGHLYGVRPDGQLVCLGLDGKIVWASGVGQQFGLGSYLMAGGLIYAVNDAGRLSLVEATPARFQLLAQAQVLKGREAWGPMALAGGRLLVRDLTRLACLEVGAPERAVVE
jgi:outer membrane protein assembly factor BamB